MPWTTFADVQAQYEGTLGVEKQEWVEAKIDAAERLLNARRPLIQTWIDTGRLALANVKDAVVAAVLRVVRNPEGYTSETEGNYLYSQSRDVAAGKIFFTGDDWALVKPFSTAPPPVTITVPCYRSRP